MAESDVNLRQGPGTNYPVVGELQSGAEARVIGKDQDTAEWWCVETDAVGTAWVNAQLVTASNTDGVAIVAAPPPHPASSEVNGSWVLVADSLADWPGGHDHNNCYYLWTAGRNNFIWQDMARPNPSDCYNDRGNHGLQICRDSITANPSGDVGVQWKTNRGGTYRFEWDSPSLKFYKHADFVGNMGPGSNLAYSATFEGIIDWEMFYWVAEGSTSCHLQVYRLQQ